MPIHRTYGQKDEQDTPIGDVGFLGVDDRGDPRRIAPGMVASAKNKDFADGTAATRAGWMTPAWGGGLGVHFDDDCNGVEEGLTFDPDNDGIEEGINFEPCGLGAIYGYLVFSDPYGNEALLVANRHGVWKILNYAEPELIRLPDREKIDYPVTMIQCFDRVLMLRGLDRTILEWNPQTTFTTGTAAFTEITQTGTGTFTETIPNSEYGFSFANRAWLLQDRDTLAVSDILDYTRWDATLNSLRINAGTDDAIIACSGAKDNRILVGKRGSFYVLDGVYGTDLGYSAIAQEVTRERGVIGRKALCDMGGGQWAFLSDGGVYTIGMTEENKLRSSPAPLSWPIKGLMARVHWPYADGAILTVHAERMFLAIPIDGATGNNALFVYNLTTQHWEGYWTADYLRVVGMPIVTEHGEKRLCILNGTGTQFDAHWVAEVAPADVDAVTFPSVVQGLADGALLVTGEGYADFIYGRTAWIKDEVLTRGYGLGTLEQVKHLRATLDQETWNPSFSVFVRRGSVNSETAIAENVRRGFEGTPALTYSDLIMTARKIGSWSSDYVAMDVTADHGTWEAYRSQTTNTTSLLWQNSDPLLVSNDFAYVHVIGDPYVGADVILRPYLFTAYDLATGVVVATVSGMTNLASPNTYIALQTKVNLYGVFSLTINRSYVSEVRFYRGADATVYSNSRRQRIYGADEVVWEESISPAEIEAEGYDDYSWRLGTAILPGVTLGRMQRRTEVYRAQKSGDFLQLRTTNTRGRHVLHGTQVSAIAGRRGLGSRLA